MLLTGGNLRDKRQLNPLINLVDLKLPYAKISTMNIFLSKNSLYAWYPGQYQNIWFIALSKQNYRLLQHIADGKT